MAINDWLKNAENELTESGIKTARLDALILLEHVSKHDRAWLLANPDAVINEQDEEELKNLLNKRKAHAPMSYLLGKVEFYGREFVLNHSVLEPRPESETMIDMLKHVAPKVRKRPDLKNEDGSHISIADVGTGSGALGITAALEIKGS